MLHVTWLGIRAYFLKTYLGTARSDSAGYHRTEKGMNGRQPVVSTTVALGLQGNEKHG